jgi:epoxide hydrolase-like predicted phosphatase
MIKAIIFDIGGVITFTDFQTLYTNFANRVGISADFVSQYHKDNWTENLLGNITLEQFFQIMKDAGAKEGLDLKAIWLEEALKIRRVNNELLDIIAKLRKNYIVGVLSNLTPSRLMMDEHMSLYNHFEFVVLSCKEHLKKPDPKFYELALHKAKVRAEEAVFVDDKESNVIAAREMGFKDILYTDNHKFVDDIKKLGVSFNE